MDVHDNVVFGGTFDHLHAGHKIMITVAAASASRSLVIGLSGLFGSLSYFYFSCDFFI
jgi:phosphopantetheine adenylyltransferase